ncbi:MAG: aminoacyl-tRNA hydrolase [Anaerolineales bacterium]|nr:aminoacyl-tRNA hydrolase [Anaerolineales bacterium]
MRLFRPRVQTSRADLDAGQAPNGVYLIVGLGNPGREYRNNRHNIGFLLLDRLAGRLDATFSRVESRALVARAAYLERRVILAKPQTYMNLSGQAVGALVHFYKIPLDHLLVAYDDVDLPFGALRLRPDGGSAGQKGMQSIIERLGSEDFPRLRLGIDRPAGRKEVSAHVLEDFSRAESEELPAILDRGADAVFSYLVDGLEIAMTRYNAAHDA